MKKKCFAAVIVASILMGNCLGELGAGSPGSIAYASSVMKKSETECVEITEVPGEGSSADISNLPSSVTLSDPEAEDSAKALFVYLSALKESDQVLFGHQNDVSKQVNSTSSFGDVYDVTGQVSGVFGIDSLALAGTEAGGNDATSALENSVEYSKKAAENGAIITLSMHMPNFSNNKVVKNPDGTYNFFGCDFEESKDLSNDIVKQILPGGAYQDAFQAYLDIIADYAGQLQKDGIPILFRPFHENTGNWFWWGSANSPETYKSLFRYTRDYLEGKGIHNMLWVYSPGGPIDSEDAYLSYYPGDEYVDIFAFDYYDDYDSYPATVDNSYFTKLDATCKVVSELAKQRGKLAAISECGVRVRKEDGSDMEGLLMSGNPVGTEAGGQNWYLEVSNIAKKYDMPYYLVWANFSNRNFYVPYKQDDTHGQELINDFIAYYNDESSVFGKDTQFYDNITTLADIDVKYDSAPAGYMVYPFEADALKNDTCIRANVKNAEQVQFKVTNTENGNTLILDAESVSADQGNTETIVSGSYQAELTEDSMNQLGKTDVASIALLADGNEIALLHNISLGQEKEKAPADVFEDFDYYSGSNGLLDSVFDTKSATGCSSEFLLSSENVVDGDFGGAFHYNLVSDGEEGWSGQIKSELVDGDFSKYNAISMWVKPDGNAQKLVVQLTDASKEEFEVYLSDFVKGTEAKYVTIPFDSFKGKNGGTLDTSQITKFAIWCNTIIPEDNAGKFTVDSVIYFDSIHAVLVPQEILNQNPVDDYGLIITNEPLEQAMEGVQQVETESEDTGKEDDVEPEVSTEKKAEPVAMIVIVIGIVVAVLGGFAFILRKEKDN